MPENYINLEGCFMKKILVAAILLASSSVFALEYTNAVRGSTMIVEVVHSQSRMMEALGNPDSSYRHVIQDRKGWSHKATTYTYRMNNARYEITVVDGKVYSIGWERE